MTTVTEIKEYNKYVKIRQTINENIRLLSQDGMDLARVANSNLCHHLSTLELFHTDFPARYREEENRG